MQYGSVNPELLGLARRNISRFAQPLVKKAFVPGGDPSMGGGDPSQGGGAPPGGDPSQGGGGPPPGGDPSGGAGGPPPGPPPGGSDPTAGMGGNPGDISSMIQQQVQAAVAGMGGGAAGAGAGVKPKIDQNVVMLQILKLLAKISDTLGISIPASEMVVTPQDLQAMAQGGPGAAVVQDQQQQQGAPPPGGGIGAIKPVQPMAGAAPPGGGGEKSGADRFRQQGTAFDTRGLEQTMNKASAILAIRGHRKGRAA